jgi:pimeloyl-ACP methyl ester carboxylesterase
MEQRLAINGHDLYVEVRGPQDGPAVVLLHHGLGAVRSWKEQIPALASAGFKVLVYDRWGHGSSEVRAEYGMPLFLEDQADLAALLERYDITQTALVGHSDGGKVAMYWAAAQAVASAAASAAAWPARVTCLVVVSTHIYIEKKMSSGIEEVRRDFELDAEFQDKMARVHGDQAEDVFWGWYNGWSKPEHLEWDMRPLIHSIACPTLVVQGLEDEHASPQHARDIAAAIPGADLWLVPEAGHMLPQDFPEMFNQKLLDFLAIHHPSRPILHGS